MESRTYTLKEAVFALNRSGSDEEASRLTRHLRHWTSMDLLKPEGKKHTGTGKSREYSADTIYRAAVLVELAKWHVPMTVLADAFASFTEGSEGEWELAVKDDTARSTVYLTMTWSDEGSNWILQCDFPLVDAIEELYSDDDEELEPMHDGKSVPASIIAINLSRLLRWVKL